MIVEIDTRQASPACPSGWISPRTAAGRYTGKQATATRRSAGAVASSFTLCFLLLFLRFRISAYPGKGKWRFFVSLRSERPSHWQGGMSSHKHMFLMSEDLVVRHAASDITHAAPSEDPEISAEQMSTPHVYANLGNSAFDRPKRRTLPNASGRIPSRLRPKHWPQATPREALQLGPSSHVSLLSRLHSPHEHTPSQA